MSNRQDTDRQSKLEPKRIQYAKEKIEGLGYDIIDESTTRISFLFKKQVVTFFPYSGWATGITINDGRGIDELLKQIS